jgi:hypothetical protein
MYWAYHNSRVCVIWAFVIPGFFKNRRESLWLIWPLTTIYDHLKEIFTLIMKKILIRAPRTVRVMATCII